MTEATQASPAVLPPLVPMPALPPGLPQRPYPLLVRWGARLILATLGVRLAGGFANTPRAVLVGWPHTSNLDGIIAMAGVTIVGLRPTIAVKHSLFRYGLGGFMRLFGAFPLRRSTTGEPGGGAVAQFTERFDAAAAEGRPLWIAISPEGTRARGTGWRTGWHRTAVAAGVPVAVLAFDWGRTRSERRLLALGAVAVSGDLAADTAAVEALYAGIVGRHPENATPA